MADNFFVPVNKMIYDTASKIVDLKITANVSDVLKTVIDSSTKVVDNVLEKIKNLTKEE